MKPILSFYIPVYKKPVDVFRKCLTHIFDSSLKEIEVICVFDGADENLWDVANEFPKVRNLVIEHGGAPKARNAGLALATGKYVVAWDADCYIKPNTAKRWIEEFEAVPDADFVYTGYEMSGEAGEFSSESFSAYALESGNYISTMSPIKREKAPQWDEGLAAAQDWDYWLTAVESGCKGAFIEGSGFVTDEIRTGISSVHWTQDNRDRTMLTVRHKHGIPDREIGVYTTNYREMGIKLAQILGADVIKPTGLTPTKYKMIVNLGYGFLSRFGGIADDVVKIQYWIPGEIEGLCAPEARYKTVVETVKIAKTVVNYCGTTYEANKLGELGIEAEVLPLPLANEDMEKVSRSLPEKFTILLATDKSYADLLKDISVDLPHITFLHGSAKVADFSCFVSFYQFAALDAAMLTAHVNGRHVISNVQAPYCGFVDPDQTWEKFKQDLYEKIGEVSKLPLNTEAQTYYEGVAAPVPFRDKICGLLKKEMAVV